jgi:hypothetical protein
MLCCGSLNSLRLRRSNRGVAFYGAGEQEHEEHDGGGDECPCKKLNGIDATLEPMTIAREAIKRLSDFFFNTLQLDDTFTKVGIKAEDIPLMARKACGGGTLEGFKPLNQKDIEAIFTMCI